MTNDALLIIKIKDAKIDQRLLIEILLCMIHGIYGVTSCQLEPCVSYFIHIVPYTNISENVSPNALCPPFCKNLHVIVSVSCPC